eukprot:TRINITY_DN26648_c0_g2_i1.p1 TRINITY_DN26648_c0_g2~~TRINITY_DN26648_c0_g2_i1.p1  ORF type:complete len:545 (-),score=124.55 TRINITY_DN26648_c0_g2_i1:37-1671(-)
MLRGGKSRGVAATLRHALLLLLALLPPLLTGTPGDGLTQQPRLVVKLAASVSSRLALMCHEEGVSEDRMLQGWIEARQDLLSQPPAGSSSGSSRKLVAGSRAARGQDESGEVAAAPACPHAFDLASLDGCQEVFGVARAEVLCPESFIRAVITFGGHLLESQSLDSYDIMHEVIRAETGYKVARLNGVPIAEGLFDEFMDFQQRLANILQGWKLWEYEFHHWKYFKRPLEEDDYAQLYNSIRPLSSQHVTCPAVPLAYRMWSNFPTCAPTRLRDLPRFFDAYVSAMTVDNWRAGYRDFLSEGYNYNTSFFAGGDPTQRLSKGAHSIFAGVFLQKFPTDLWCYQQIIHDLKPRYIIELGSSQGGSAVWFASMLKLFELPGKVVTVDLAQEQAYWLNSKRALDAARRLKLEDRIDWNYVTGGSTNEDVRAKVRKLCEADPCMVVSDSDHDYHHTYHELEWYASLVGVGQYLVVEDTNIYGWSGWLNINDPNLGGIKKGPMEAANDFELAHRADFERTDWCAKHYGLSQTPNGWFFRKDKRARGRRP